MSIKAKERGVCPHCKTSNRFEYSSDYNYENVLPGWDVKSSLSDNAKSLRLCRCTDCGENIIFFDEIMIHPLGSTRPPCPLEVPSEISEDYKEACLVEHLSSKAAAALARRCLQNMLREKGINVSSKKLFDEIDEAMKNLPSGLSESIDAIRNIGNFATHPEKSTNTGEIVEVEVGETEWTLDVIEELFDYYYVQPTRNQAKRDALNQKLQDAGKPSMK